MASNSFGNIFKITTWGESHGKAIGVVIDGCPAGLPLDENSINAALALRAPGRNPYTSPRTETDKAEILSGVFEGKTTGAPICIIIPNKDADSSKYKSGSDAQACRSARAAIHWPQPRASSFGVRRRSPLASSRTAPAGPARAAGSEARDRNRLPPTRGWRRQRQRQEECHAESAEQESLTTSAELSIGSATTGGVMELTRREAVARGALAALGTVQHPGLRHVPARGPDSLDALASAAVAGSARRSRGACLARTGAASPIRPMPRSSSASASCWCRRTN